MRNYLALLALAVTATTQGQTPAVTENSIKFSNNDPALLLNLTSTDGASVRGATTPEFPGDPIRFGVGALGVNSSYWYPKMLDPSARVAHNAVMGLQNEAHFWTSGFDGVQTKLVYNYGSSDMIPEYQATFPGHVQDVLLRSRGSFASAWLVPGAVPKLYFMPGRLRPFNPVAHDVPGAERLVDLQTLPSGVAFLTTKRANGLVDYRSLFSKGGVRWTRTFPAGTLLKIDPSGHTYAAVPTAAGIEIHRFDFNANPEGITLLPIGFGDRLLSASADPNHYFFVLLSRPDNGRRLAQVVRINPSLSSRMHPLPAFLATGAPGTVECDPWGQAYVVTTTTTQGINTERVATFDTLSFKPIWQDARTLSPGESAANTLPTEGGVILWGNRPTANGPVGFTRKYAENALQTLKVTSATNIQNGGGDGYFAVQHYGRVDEPQTYTLKSNHPDLVLPATLTIAANQTGAGTAIAIPQGSTRRYMRIEAENVETRQKRSMTLVVNPWVEPTLMSATFYPNSVVGGNQTELRVWLAEDSKGWTVAHLSATGSGIVLPDTMTLPKGKVARLYFDTLPVAAKVVRRVDVRVGSITKSDFLSINP